MDSHTHCLLDSKINEIAHLSLWKIKCWKVIGMRKILFCEFNLDTACVELRLDNETLFSIDCIAVENERANSMYRRLELDWFIYNDPLTYVELILNVEPELYLKTVTVSRIFGK